MTVDMGLHVFLYPASKHKGNAMLNGYEVSLMFHAFCGYK